MNHFEQPPRNSDQTPTEQIRTGEELRNEAWYCWVGYIGSANTDAATESFNDNYLGYFSSRLAFARDLLTSQGVYQKLDDTSNVLPERVKRFMSFDEASYADSLDDEYYLAPSNDGGVHAFLASE